LDLTDAVRRHPRSYERDDFVFDPLHYLALIEQKINALDQAAPLAGWQLPAVDRDMTWRTRDKKKDTDRPVTPFALE
jgi:hypothetical protein